MILLVMGRKYWTENLRMTWTEEMGRTQRYYKAADEYITYVLFLED